jgi:hypothetical protein
MYVVVLGCGPAGLFAAHAAKMMGHEVQILSKKRQSHMYGAQYLHNHIPGLTSDHPGDRFEVDYRLIGSAEDYAAKVYGSDVPRSVSPQRYRGRQPAWDIREAYSRAYRRYEDLITEQVVEASTIAVLLQDRNVDVVVNTIPANQFCVDIRHAFIARNVWAIGDAPERNIFAPRLAPNETVLCNGTDEVGWYRASNIRGFNTVEWPEDRRPPIDGVARVTKPVSNTCNCWESSGKYWRVGRYGTWQKGVLSHHAYWRTYEALKVMEL